MDTVTHPTASNDSQKMRLFVDMWTLLQAHRRQREWHSEKVSELWEVIEKEYANEYMEFTKDTL